MVVSLTNKFAYKKNVFLLYILKELMNYPTMSVAQSNMSVYDVVPM